MTNTQDKYTPTAIELVQRGVKVHEAKAGRPKFTQRRDLKQQRISVAGTRLSARLRRGKA